MKTFNDRIQCWESTKKMCEQIDNPPISIKYEFNNNFIFRKKYKTHIFVVNYDSLDCGITLKEFKFNPVVLNMADTNFPGGCVDLGSGAQEESLFRRTNYFKTLNLTSSNHLYPLTENEAIYSKDEIQLRNTFTSYKRY